MAGKPKRDAPPTQARKGSACIHRTCKLITLILSIYIQNTKLKLDIFFKRKKDEREGSKGKHQRVPHFLHQQKWDQGFPGGSDGKESACNAGDLGSIPGWGRFPGVGSGKPTSVFLPGESHGQRGLAGYGPQGRQELDMTKRLTHWYCLAFRIRRFFPDSASFSLNSLLWVCCGLGSHIIRLLRL